MAKPSISVCLISGAEAHRIRPTFESVAEWTDEIIVVLNEEAGDDTEKIAREFDAKVFREPWKGYVTQKNSASDKASSDWLLALDADEVVSPELRDEIVELLREPRRFEPYAGFSFPRCSLYHGRWIRHGDWYPDRKLRLWRRGLGRWEGVMLHEKVVTEGRVGKLQNDLLHYGTGGIEEQLHKMIRYATVFAEGCAAQGKTVSVLDLLVRPPWRFCRGFFFKLGFLDGWQGVSISWMTAFYTFVRYFKALEVQDKPLRGAAPQPARGAGIPVRSSVERQ